MRKGSSIVVGGDICLLMGWQCLNWLRRGEDGDVADIVPCGRCDLKVAIKFLYLILDYSHNHYTFKHFGV